MNFQYSYYGIIPLISAFIVLFLAVYSYKKGSSKLHFYFLFLSISVFFWCFGSAMVFFSSEIAMNIFWNKINYIGAAFAPAMWFVVILKYLKYEKYLKPLYLGLIMFLPLVIVSVAFTNEWHMLLWSNITYISNQSESLLIYAHGPFFWVTIAYSFSVTMVGIILLIRMFINSSSIYRHQIFFLILSGLVPIIFSVIYICGIFPVKGIDVTSFGLSISGILVAMSIFKLRFLDIRPIAHNMLFKSIMGGALIFGMDNKLIEVNSAANLVGISNKDIGKKADDIFSSFPDLKSFYNGSKSESELFLGNPVNRWIHVQISPIYDNENVFHGRLVIIQDINKRKNVEEELKMSLEEKDLMMLEINHRVKNNMQIMSSLLSLQLMYHDNEEVKNILLEFYNRIQSMALVHEKLYQNEKLSQIDIKEYLDQVILNLFTSYKQDTGKIKTFLDIESVKMDIKTAVPLGLIINELLTNSLKYAFPQGKGKLSLKLSLVDNCYHLIVADDGIGLPSDFKIEKTKTLGLQLVNRLVRQLRGHIELNISEGTEFYIKFPYTDQVRYNNVIKSNLLLMVV